MTFPRERSLLILNIHFRYQSRSRELSSFINRKGSISVSLSGHDHLFAEATPPKITTADLSIPLKLVIPSHADVTFVSADFFQTPPSHIIATAISTRIHRGSFLKTITFVSSNSSVLAQPPNTGY